MNLNLSYIFSADALVPIAQNIIAAILYDFGKEGFTIVQRKSIEDIFYESILVATENTVENKELRHGILKTLQYRNLASIIENFRQTGQPLDEDFFEKQFAQVTSHSTAKRIAPVFLKCFRKKLAANKVLSHEMVLRYLDAIQKGQWKFHGSVFEQLESILKELKKNQSLLKLSIPYQTPANQIKKPSQLFQANNSFIEMIGREREMTKLKKFCDVDEVFRWIVITGEGGIGKTRLAQDFAKDRFALGWDAGFLNALSLIRLVEHHNFSEWHPVVNTLIVVDYAATKTHHIKNLLERCAEYSISFQNGKSPSEASRIRILLLERYADLQDGWLEGLLGTGEKNIRDEIKSGFDGLLELLTPYHKEQIKSAEIVKKILLATFSSWKRLYKKSPPELPEFGEVDFALIHKNTQGRPLYLQMAAIHACQLGNAKGIPSWGRGELLRAAVELERKYIQTECPEQGLRTVLERSIAILCLTGLAVTRQAKWIKALRKEIQKSGWDNLEPAVIEEKRKILYPIHINDSNAGNDIPINPDILAAAFAATIFQRGNQDLSSDFIIAVELGGLETWGNMLRLVQDLSGVDGYKGVESWLSPLIKKRPYDELYKVALRLPRKTISLHWFAVDLHQELLSRLGNDHRDEERAILLNKLGEHLAGLGRQDEALDVIRKAIAICEQLVHKEWDKFAAGLAYSLHNLDRQLTKSGQSEEGLQAVKRAIEIREKLTEKDGEILPDLAGSLNNLGIRLQERGSYKDALDVYDRTVSIWENLASKNWGLFAPELARSLNNLAKCLSILGRSEEALKMSQKSVEIRENFSLQNPDEFILVLPYSLETLSDVQRQMGLHNESLQTAHKQIEIYKDLASKNPDVFLTSYASAYLNLGWQLRDLGRHEEAIDKFQKAIQIIPKYPLAYFQWGLSLENLGRHEQALDKFQKAVEIQPEYPEVYNTWGECLFRLGHFEEALKKFQKAIQSNQNYAEAHNNCGICLQNLSHHEDAIESFLKATQIQPTYALAYASWGWSLQILDRNEEAIKQFEKAIEIQPEYVEAYNALGHSLFKLARYEDAFEKFQKVIRMRPNFAEAYYDCGACLHLLGSYKEAMEQYEEAVKIHPTYAFAYNNWGHILNILGCYEEAITKFEKAVQIDPRHALAWNNWGTSLQTLNRQEEAVEKFQKAIQAQPLYAEAYFNLGLSLQALRRHEEAIEKFQQAVRTLPEYAAAYNFWGECLYDLMRHEEAIEKFQKAVQVHTGYAQAHYNLGRSLSALRRYDEAIQKFERAIQIHSEFVLAYAYWGYCLNNLGRHDDAIEKYKRATQLQPEYAYAYYNWGNTLSDLGRYEEAFEKYEVAIQKRPDYAEAYSNWGRALNKQGNYEEAYEKFQKAVQINPECTDAYINWGLSLDDAECYGEAIEKFQKATQIQPENAVAYNTWGLTLIHLGQYEEANKKFQKAIQIEPEYAGAYYNWGFSLTEWRHGSEAFEKFQQAIQIDPRHYTAWAGIGWYFYADMKDYPRSIEAYQKALENNSDTIWIHCNLAIALLHNDNYVAAEREYQAAIQIIRDSKASKRQFPKNVKELEYHGIGDLRDAQKVVSGKLLGQINNLISVLESEVQNFKAEIFGFGAKK
ncbi:MAG: Lipopolysaccharide assembly protein B [Syntrophorhabdaceae bacterium]|nr:Lipopolysaccharide assembly protein B [Syntrophorhabdaceae bacterium]